jgi:hypothetical protein
MPDGRPVAVGDAPVGGQAVLEGVMMRGVSVWAVACRTPEGRIDVTSEPIVSWAKRSRIWRLPVIRGVVALAESLKIGFRALAISANKQLAEGEEEEEIGGFTWGLTIFFSLLLAVGLFFVIPVGATSLIKDWLGSALLFWLVEGVLRTALRDQLPPDRDGACNLRLRADRSARLVLAGRVADPRHPADRGPLIRGHQVGRQEPEQAVGASADVAGSDAPEPDHARA